MPDLPLFRDEAERGLRVFKRLRVPDMVGMPALGDAAGPWMFPIIAAIFGSYDPDAAQRMIQEFFWLIAKKNGKTSTAAAVAVTVLIVNRRPAAEIVIVSTTKSVADRTFDHAAGTIRADPELAKVFHIQRHIHCITHRRTGATLQVKAADTDVVTGGKQLVTIIDEIHELASKPTAPEIMVELRGALAARPDGFLLTITTQSKQPPRGVFKAELDKAREVRDGRLVLPILPILYELPRRLSDKGGWRDEKFWSAVNPNLDRSVSLDFLRNELIAADHEGAEKLALIASQHFNVEVGSALRSDRWAGADFWESASDPGLTLEALLNRCEVAAVGIDGGGLDDLLGVAVVGREKVTKRWLAWAVAWGHAVVRLRRKEIATQLDDFAKDGDFHWHGDAAGWAADRTAVAELVAEAGNEAEAVFAPPPDIAGVCDIVRQVDESGLLAGVGLDPAGVGAIVDALAEINVGGPGDSTGADRVVGVSQGWKLMSAIKTVERKLADGSFVHADQALLTWCVSNAKVEPRGNAMIITKQASGTGKIDPLMALLDAAAIMGTNPEGVGASIYDRAELFAPPPNVG